MIAPLVGLFSALVPGHTDAAPVTVDETVTFTTSPENEIVRPPNRIYTITAAELGSFDATSSDKLIVAFSSENAGTVQGITYGGVAMTEAIFTSYSTGTQFTGIFYLDHPAGNGDLVFDFTGGNGVGGSLMAVSGTAAGFGATNSGDGQTISLTTTAGNSLVVASHANNGDGAIAQSPPTGPTMTSTGLASPAGRTIW